MQEACKKTNTELLIILKEKYFFKEHCLYFKKYLLMGQGDLFEYLMDLVSDELDRQANQVYKHTLRAYLD